MTALPNPEPKREPFLPGSTLGILGSGQLGRMLAMAAKRMGYKVVIYSPDKDTPAGQVSDVEISAPYDDAASLKAFAAQVDVITLEFENIPADTVKTLSESVPVYPQAGVLETTQNRLREKYFLSLQNFPIVPFAPVDSLEELKTALEQLGCPAVLKTAGFGYDGKGQVRIDSPDQAETAYAAMQGQPAVLEAFVDLDRELSVVAVCNGQDDIVTYAPVENRHANHILDITIAPANVPEELGELAQDIARRIMRSLKMRGVLCVEFFLSSQGQLLVNELAPRPHNSGHYSIEACPCSQFEQQLRAVCGLPLGSTRQLIPAAMGNLLGDLWEGGEPDWSAVCTHSLVYLHLYGKPEPRKGRKMGHLTALGGSPEEALERVTRARDALAGKTPAEA